MVLALVLLSALASAQAPAPGTTYQLRVNGGPNDTIRKSHGSAEYEFEVSMQCRAVTGEYTACTGTQGDATADVRISESKKSAYPTGWRVNVDPESFTMRAGDAPKVVTVTVSLLTDDPEKDSITVEIEATGTVRSSLPLVPIETAVPARDSVKTEKILDGAEQLVSYLKRFMWPLIGIGAILLIAAFVLRERKKGSVELQTDTEVQELLPGRGASFALTVRNESRDEDRIHLGAGPLPPGWVSIIPLTEIDLHPGERSQIWLTVRAPSRVRPGESVPLDVTARSTRFRGREARLALSVIVAEPAPTQPSSFPPAAPPAPPEPLEPLVLDTMETRAKPAVAVRRRKKKSS